MPGSLSISPVPNDMSNLSEQMLEKEGFTREQIEQLRDLRDAYPYVEWFASKREWHHVRFVKWLYMQGEFEK